MKNVVLQTARLALRLFDKNDASHLYALNADSEVLQFTGDEPFENETDAALFIEKYSAYSDFGMGRWAVIRREDGAFLGWCGLKYDKQKKEVDIGFRFFKTYWNQGYATEAAEVCMACGFLEKKLHRIVGRARKENLASIRVLEKMGLVVLEEKMGWLIYEKWQPRLQS